MKMVDIILIIWMHFIADFILQSDKIAINKSKNNYVLTKHVIIYTIPFIILSLFIPLSVYWIIFNGVAHWITDYITSRWTSYLWKNDERHWFFVVIGLDQSLHMSALLVSLIVLRGGYGTFFW